MGRKIALDTNVFVYALEDDGKLGEEARKLFDRIKRGNTKAYTSSITIHEVLTGVYKKGNEEDIPDYLRAISGGDEVKIADFTTEVAIISARIRVAYKLKTPDAIQIGTAIALGASRFVTFDKRIPRNIEGLK